MTSMGKRRNERIRPRPYIKDKKGGHFKKGQNKRGSHLRFVVTKREERQNETGQQVFVNLPRREKTKKGAQEFPKYGSFR